VHQRSRRVFVGEAGVLDRARCSWVDGEGLSAANVQMHFLLEAAAQRAGTVPS
jgi:hypothetical protein